MERGTDRLLGGVWARPGEGEVGDRLRIKGEDNAASRLGIPASGLRSKMKKLPRKAGARLRAHASLRIQLRLLTGVGLKEPLVSLSD